MYSVVTRSSTVSRWLWHSIWVLLMTILVLAVRLENAMQTLSSRAQTFRTVLSSYSLATDIFSTPRTTLTAVQPLFMASCKYPTWRDRRWWWRGYSSCLRNVAVGLGKVHIHCHAAGDSQRCCTSTARPPAPLCFAFIKTLFPSVAYQTSATAKSLQLCRLCNPIPGILQSRTLEWVAISFSSA